MSKFLIFLILLSACSLEYKTVEPYYIFHDNASKVWLINHLYENGKDLTPLSLNYKKLLVFHSTGLCYEYNLHELGNVRGRKGVFRLTIDEKRMDIEYKKETIHFDIEYLSAKKIKLMTKGKNGKKIQIELITFPEY